MSRDVFFACFERLGMTHVEIDAMIKEKHWLQGSTDGQRINLVPVAHRLPNFASHCSAWLGPEDTPTTMADLRLVVARYTGNTIFADLNLYLATDCQQGLVKEAKYIQKLMFCFTKCPGYEGTVFRVLEMSTVEIEAMKAMGEFYFPGFVSTSKSSPLAHWKGNTVLKIETAVGVHRTLDIDSSRSYAGVSFSDFSSEREVLITCYSRFKLVGEEPAAGGKRIIKLELMDPLGDHGEVLDWYHQIKGGGFDRAFAKVAHNPHKRQALSAYRKPTSGWTALHQAAWFGDQAAVTRLLDMGANMNAKGRNGETPPQVAVQRGNAICWA